MDNELIAKLINSLDRIADEIRAMRIEQTAIIEHSKQKADAELKNYVGMMESILSKKKQSNAGEQK